MQKQLAIKIKGYVIWPFLKKRFPLYEGRKQELRFRRNAKESTISVLKEGEKAGNS